MNNEGTVAQLADAAETPRLLQKPLMASSENGRTKAYQKTSIEPNIYIITTNKQATSQIHEWKTKN